MQHILAFIKKETVLIIAAFAAIISMFFVPPSQQYAEYIDFSVLSLLFCLMIVISGFISTNLFGVISSKILHFTSNIRTVAFILVNICFFGAMLVTNDVALLTLVPFTIGLLKSENADTLIFIIIMETISANLGSMITPIGNPQNLYLYTQYNIGISEFFSIILPIGGVSYLFIMASTLFIKKKPLSATDLSCEKIVDKWRFCVYCLLFIACILTVLRVLNYIICLLIVGIIILIINPKLYKRVDYSLLLTFVAFFVFVGNISSIADVRSIISRIICGNELVSGICISQIISNVPAAIMMSGFTENYKALLIGVDLGGLGTLVASLASLITFKIYANSQNADKKKYLLRFTLINFLFLALLGGIYILFLR